MQAVLTRKRSGCSASAPSVEGSPFPSAGALRGELSGQSRFALPGGYFSRKMALVAEWLQSFKEFPPGIRGRRHRTASSRARTGDTYAQAVVVTSLRSKWAVGKA